MANLPERNCNGGPNGHKFCGRPASHVARDESGLEWFCCVDHTEGAGQRLDTRLLTMAAWFSWLEQWEREPV